MTSYANSSMYVARNRKKSGVTAPRGDVLRPKGLGDAQSAPLEEIEAALRRLSAQAPRMKNTLSSTVMADFRSVVNTVTLLRGTDHYPKLKQMILGAFPNRPYDVGTVGGYFVNCVDTASRDLCSAPCVGNLVLDDGVEDVCPTRVFVLKFEGAAMRTLLALNDVPDTSRAIVYIYLDPSRHFGGLTASEIESLTNRGVREVDMYYYNPATYEQVPITSGFVSIGSLTPVPCLQAADNSGLFLALLVIFVLLLLAFGAWYLMKKPKPKLT